ncbi:hypothetical protein V8F20_000519 [Naviculisporaceae sp. PSN 640]
MALFGYLTARLGRVNRYNLQTLREAPAAEISGALGDLGTLLPLMIALAIQGAIDLPTTLVFTGVFNIATGAVFGIPLPVQPMKAIAAASLASKSSLAETTAAGGLVGLAVLFLSIIGLIRWLTVHIPVPVVKGIQLGAGLQLIISAGSSLILPLGWLAPMIDNRFWALVTFLALIMVTPPGFSNKQQKHKTPPYALLVFIIGLCFALLKIALLEPSSDGDPPRMPSFSSWHPFVRLPRFLSPESIGMALSQLPLTTLNSIIAVCALADSLFPTPLPIPSSLPPPAISDFPLQETPSPNPPSTTAIGLTVALMNILSCFFGSMPVCHGSGGLAGQYRFGARSGASVILLGLSKVLLGLFLGNSLIDLLESFPRGLLGVMVFGAGLELAKAGVVDFMEASRDLDITEEEEEDTERERSEEEDLEVEIEGYGGDVERGGSSSRSQSHSDSRATGTTTDGGRGREQGDNSTSTGIKQKQPRVLTEDERNERWTVLLMTAGGILAFKNDAVGFTAGLLCHGAYRLAAALAAAESGSTGVSSRALVDSEERTPLEARTMATPGRKRRPGTATGTGRKYYFLSGRRRRKPSMSRAGKQTQTQTQPHLSRRETDGEDSPLLGSDSH